MRNYRVSTIVWIASFYRGAPRKFSPAPTDAIAALKQRYASKQQNSNLSNEPTAQLLNDLELTTSEGITYAALILLGKREAIRKYLPQDEVIVEYRLHENSIPYTARQEFQEPLMLAIDKIWNYINHPASNPLQHISDGPYIFDLPAFNEESIREAVLNALCHRSMQIKSSVVIKQSPDSITITNAGGFPIGVDIYNILTTPSVPRAKQLCEVLQKTGLIERSGQGVDKIYYNCLEEGKPLPDYSKSDAYLVVLKLKGEIEDPAFHLFVDEEQGRRDESNRLSVFHLMELYKVKEGKTDLLNAEIIDNLMNQGLVVAEHDTLRLCDAYQKKKEVMNTPQSRWEAFNQQLGVRLGVNDIIKESFKGKDIENQIDTLNKGLKEKLGVNTPNPLKKKLGVNRYSIILLLYFFPNMTIVRLAELTELSSTTIEKNVAWLKEHGLIAREGSDKNGTWRVIL